MPWRAKRHTGQPCVAMRVPLQPDAHPPARSCLAAWGGICMPTYHAQQDSVRVRTFGAGLGREQVGRLAMCNVSNMAGVAAVVTVMLLGPPQGHKALSL